MLRYWTTGHTGLRLTVWRLTWAHTVRKLRLASHPVRRLSLHVLLRLTTGNSVLGRATRHTVGLAWHTVSRLLHPVWMLTHPRLAVPRHPRLDGLTGLHPRLLLLMHPRRHRLSHHWGMLLRLARLLLRERARGAVHRRHGRLLHRVLLLEVGRATDTFARRRGAWLPRWNGFVLSAALSAR